MSVKIVSVDFDGVISQKTFHRDLVDQGKKKAGPRGIFGRVMRLMDWWWTKVNQTWRKPVDGSDEGLRKLRRAGYEIVMLTSRKSYLRAATLEWVRRWGYFELYDKFYFNNTFIGAADSKVLNVGKVGSDIHIDDNWTTIIKLSENYPNMRLWYLGEKRKNSKYKNVEQFKSWIQIIKLLGLLK
jgi:uncharacterized HAD superfamily protein